MKDNHKTKRSRLDSFLAILLSFMMVWTMIPSLFFGSMVFAAAGGVPVHNKTLTPNGDGTYKLSLDIKGESEKKVTRTNVVVVLDTSGSMKERAGNTTRMAAAQKAVNSLANTLLSYNGKDGNPADTFELALISFSNVATPTSKTTSYSTFSSRVNNLSAEGGTNWEDALQEANSFSFGDSDNTYVIFVSDGNPTFRNTRGNYQNLDYNWDYYNQYGIYGTGSDDNTTTVERCYVHARDDAKDIVDGGKVLYTIGAYGNVDRMEALNTYAGGSGYYNASSTAALEEALEEIVAEISRAGFSDVQIDDGTPANIQVGESTTEVADLLEIEPNSFKYYRSGGTYGSKTEWTDIPDNCKATNTGGQVKWNLSELGVLEDGVTYTVEFNVYPSQYTYDLIADLQNGVKTYSELPQSVRDYLTSSYGLRTNTEAKITYKDTRETNPTEKTANYVNPDPVETTAEEINVEKVWVGTYEEEQDQASFQMSILRNGDNFDTLTLTKDGTKHKGSRYIATGLLRADKTAGTVQVLDPGYDYQLAEPEGLSYHWELDADIMHPMLINGTLTMLAEVEGEDVPAGMGTKGYYKDGDKEYYQFNKNVYLAKDSSATLSATNTRRSNLNLTKAISGNKAPEGSKFTYTIKVINSNAEAGTAGNTDSDYWLWFSVYDTINSRTVSGDDLKVSGTGLEGPNASGYYHIPSSNVITVTLQEGWNLRFTNLPTGSTYEITESATMPTGFSFDKVELTGAPADDPNGFKAEGTKATGTITAGDTSYTVKYTNKYVPVTAEPEVVKKVTGKAATESFEFSIAYDKSDAATAAAYENGDFVMPDTTTVTTKAEPLIADGGQETAKFEGITFYKEGTYKFIIDETTTTTAKGWTYDADTETITVTVRKGQDGKLVATVDKTPEFENVYHALPVTDNIPVKKDVSPNEGVDDITGKFTFTIAAKEPANAPLPATTTVTSGKSGDTKFFGDIQFKEPGTYTYTVTETVTQGANVGSITLDAKNSREVTVTVTDNNGQLVTNIDDKKPLTFTNPYKVTAIDAVIPVTKSVPVDRDNGYVGPADNAGTFTFTLVPVNDAAKATMSKGSYVLTTGAAGGQAQFGQNADKIHFTHPGTYTYRVTESGTVAGVTNDKQTTRDITVVVTDKGQGVLEATVNGGAEIKFTNPYDADSTDYTIPVKKTLKVSEGTEAPKIAGKYTFTLKDEKGATVDTTTNPSDNGGTSSFKTLTFDKPGTYTYTVTESENGEHIAGMSNDTSTKNVVILVEDNGEGQLVASCDNDGNNPVEFTNRYDEAKVAIPVTKILAANEAKGLVAPEVEAGSFKFTLTPVTAGAPMPATGGDVVYNPDKTGGTAYFGEITFKEAGDYTYRVTEEKVSGKAPGYTNDPEASTGKLVTVHVSFEDVTKTVTTEVTETVTEEVPAENNNSEAADAAAEEPAENPAAEADDAAEAGDAAENAEQAEAAETTEKEEASEPETTTVEKEVTREVTKEVTEKVLTTEITAGKNLSFTNTYDVEDTTASFPVVKQLNAPEESNVDIKNKFTFTLTASNPADAPMPEVKSYTNPASDGGEMTFGSITYTQPGQYVYTVTETAAAEVPGVTPGTGTGTVTVNVTDNGNGTLTATPTSNAESKLTFVNTYSYGTIDVVLQAQKTLATVPEGLAVKPEIAGQYTFVLAPVDGAPMPAAGGEKATNAANGNAQFGTITYTAPGTYKYTITETGSVLGVVNDKTPVRNVEVKIEDNGDSTFSKTVKYSDGTDAQEKFTNTYETVNVPVTKEWKDNDNQDGKRPANIEITLSGKVGGKEVDWDAFAKLGVNVQRTVTVTADPDTGDWAYTYTNLPKTAEDGAVIEYTVTEKKVDEYTTEITGDATSGYKITNTHEPEKINIEGEKEWIDANGNSRTDSIVLTLQKVTKEAGSEIEKIVDVATVEATKANNYKFQFTNLNKYENGAEIVYRVVEAAVEGYTMSGGEVVFNEETQKYEVKITNTRDTGDLKITKAIGEDSDLGLDKVPADTEFTITGPDDYNNGTGTRTVTFGEDFTNGVYLEEDVPSGTYTVTESGAEVTGYTLVTTYDEASEDAESGTAAVAKDQEAPAEVTVTNTYKAIPYTLTVTKTFEGIEGTDFDEVAENFKINVTYTKTDGTAGTAEFTTANAAEGSSYTWTIEDALYNTDVTVTESGYDHPDYTETTSVQVTGATAQTTATSATFNMPASNEAVAAFSNSYESTSYNAVKVWNDNNDADEVRPDSVSVQLYKDGEAYGDPVTLNEENEWAHTWTPLEKGAEYEVKELDAAGKAVAEGGNLNDDYTVKYAAEEGTEDAGTTTITNSHQSKPVKEGWTGTKETRIDGKPVEPGQKLNYSISYTNTTGQTAETVKIIDKIPAHTKYVEGSAVPAKEASYDEDTKTLTWTFENVKNGDSKNVEFQVEVLDDMGEIVTNTAEVQDGINEDGYESNPVTSSKPVKDVFTPEDTEHTIDGQLVQKGDQLLYKLSFTNEDDEAVDVGFTDKIPANTKFVSASDDGAYDEATGVITWAAKEVAPGDPIEVTFVVEVLENDGEVIDNQGKAFVDENEFNTNVTHNPTPKDPEKTVYTGENKINIDGKPVEPGQELTYEIKYENTTGKDAETVTITDTIPKHTTYVEGSAEPAADFDEETGTFTWTFKDVKKGESKTVSFKVTVDDDDAPVIENTANVKDGTNESGYDTKPVTNTKPVKDVAKADAPTVSIDGQMVQKGDQLQYKLSFTNEDDEAVEVGFTDKIPANTKFVSASDEGAYDEATGKITWAAKEVAAGEPIEVTFVVEVLENNGKVIDNTGTAIVDGNDYDTNVTHNPVPKDPEKEVFTGENKTVIDGKPVTPGQELTYEIKYENTTGKDAETVTITDTIPQHTTYVPDSADPAADFDEEAGVLTWTFKDVKKGESKTVSFKVTVKDDQGPVIENTAHVNDGSNESGYDTKPVTNTKPVKDVAKADAPTVSIDGKLVMKGDKLQYKLSYTNEDDKEATVGFTDKIPANTKYVSSTPEGTYDEATGIITWEGTKVASGETAEVTFVVEVLENNGEVIDNKGTAIVDGNDYDTNVTHNSVPKDPEKEVWNGEKTVKIDDKAVLIGQILTYVIRYKNTTGVKADVTISDEIPQYTTYVDGSASEPGAYAGGKVTWDYTLEDGEEVEVSFQVKVSADVDGTDLVNTAEAIDGTNDFTVESNPVTNPTPRQLVITKDLKNFVDHGNNETATFAFRIEGESEAYGGTYSTVAAMEFTGADTKELTVKGIPADIKNLKVTEIISGNYTPSSSGVTLGEDGKYRVTFENTYGDTEYKTGVINNYTRTEGEKATDKTTYPTGERGDNKSTQPNGSN